jgi:hypothetical protein
MGFPARGFPRAGPREGSARGTPREVVHARWSPRGCPTMGSPNGITQTGSPKVVPRVVSSKCSPSSCVPQGVLPEGCPPECDLHKGCHHAVRAPQFAAPRLLHRLCPPSGAPTAGASPGLPPCWWPPPRVAPVVSPPGVSHDVPPRIFFPRRCPLRVFLQGGSPNCVPLAVFPEGFPPSAVSRTGFPRGFPSVGPPKWPQFVSHNWVLLGWSPKGSANLGTPGVSPKWFPLAAPVSVLQDSLVVFPWRFAMCFPHGFRPEWFPRIVPLVGFPVGGPQYFPQEGSECGFPQVFPPVGFRNGGQAMVVPQAVSSGDSPTGVRQVVSSRGIIQGGFTREVPRACSHRGIPPVLSPNGQPKIFSLGFPPRVFPRRASPYRCSPMGSHK